MQIIGNLGKDCVVNTVNGKNVINFTVAHTEKYRDSQGNNQENENADKLYAHHNMYVAQGIRRMRGILINPDRFLTSRDRTSSL